MRKRGIPFLLLLSLVTYAQQRTWESYFSYAEVTSLFSGDEFLVNVSENSMFLYAPSTGNIQKITTVEGLTGDPISAVYPMTHSLLIGHENGVLGVYDLNSNSFREDPSIALNNSIGADRKNIYHFTSHNDLIYISSGFGISEYNVQTLAFGDSFYFGPNGSQIRVYQTEILGDYIYAATEIGLYRAHINSEFLILASEWENIAQGSWNALFILNDIMHGIQNVNSEIKLYALNSSAITLTKEFSGVFKSIIVNGNEIWIAFDNEIIGLNRDFNTIQEIKTTDTIFEDHNLQFSSVLTFNDTLFLGTQQNGLIEYGLSPQFISPKGPFLNEIFHVALKENEIWIVHGNYSRFYNPYPLESYGISHYINNEWDNIPYDQIFDANSLVRVITNPKDDSEVLICSYHSGLLEVRNNVPNILFNETNSGLTPFTSPGNYTIRIRDGFFDSTGNLWTITALVAEGLKKRTPNGNWESFDLSIAIDDYTLETGYSNMVQDASGAIFFGSLNNGLIGFNEQADPIFKKLTTGLPNEDVRSLAIDLDGTLWIGTTQGIRVLYSTNQFFSDDSIEARQVIVTENGNLAELLSSQFITDIQVDGNNRKWVATGKSGVFLFSEDGKETLQHFTKSNSPLPSNAVRSITIDDRSGKVYFGSPLGLVSFQGSAFAPQPSLENLEVFPNPVRPEYQGSITIRGLKSNSILKITDISGNLVYEITSEGGSVQWDTRAFNGQKVKSGVYLIFVSDQGGTETNVTKVMIIN